MKLIFIEAEDQTMEREHPTKYIINNSYKKTISLPSNSQGVCQAKSFLQGIDKFL